MNWDLLLLLAIVSAIWYYIPAPQLLKVVGWCIIAVVFIKNVLFPLL